MCATGQRCHCKHDSAVYIQQRQPRREESQPAQRFFRGLLVAAHAASHVKQEVVPRNLPHATSRFRKPQKPMAAKSMESPLQLSLMIGSRPDLEGFMTGPHY